ncbi:DedA family protein, partial [Synechocystis sp. LEGE 06083]|nr:DedA family protein [Synechocystis sp. LEGE 06083]
FIFHFLQKRFDQTIESAIGDRPQ